MRSQQLVGVHARRRWRRGRPDAALAPDLVERNFDPTGPDRLWAGDVTQFPTGEGWLHLAAVIDLWSRRVVGWAMGTTVNAELVSDALVMAFERRRPDRRVVHHSDRGPAYTSLAFSQRVVELEVDQSFGSTGDCYDNAAVESFFATLKRELAWIHATKNWPTRTALRSALFDYIEGFYNPERTDLTKRGSDTHPSPFGLVRRSCRGEIYIWDGAADLTCGGRQTVSPPPPRTRRRRRWVSSDGSTPRSARAASPWSRVRRAAERSPRASATEASTA
jgi:hypothetical protein